MGTVPKTHTLASLGVVLAVTSTRLLTSSDGVWTVDADAVRRGRFGRVTRGWTVELGTSRASKHGLIIQIIPNELSSPLAITLTRPSRKVKRSMSITRSKRRVIQRDSVWVRSSERIAFFKRFSEGELLTEFPRGWTVDLTTTSIGDGRILRPVLVFGRVDLFKATKHGVLVGNTRQLHKRAVEHDGPGNVGWKELARSTA